MCRLRSNWLPGITISLCKHINTSACRCVNRAACLGAISLQVNRFFLLFQEQNGNFSPNPARATSRLSQGSVISYASHFSRSTTRRNSDTSSVDGKTIKDFFKNMMRKFCPDRPRYFNRPLEDKHGCDDKVSSVPEHCLHLVIFYQRQWVMKLQLKIIISQVILTTFIPIAFFSQISIPLQHLLVHQSLTHSDHATNFTANSFLNNSINSTWLQVHFSYRRPVILYWPKLWIPGWQYVYQI